jgi:hypothetical protein
MENSKINGFQSLPSRLLPIAGKLTLSETGVAYMVEGAVTGQQWW